ncbi:alpha-N-acetylglucosaminidase [Streptomyces sp. BI20]|uniref:alpha-N-acetylglucosaminidase n=1 Tax=Streptomyces sp. BI20 TaxID=3403460 RepID=UPI003C75D88D
MPTRAHTSRRSVLALLAAALPGLFAAGPAAAEPAPPGPGAPVGPGAPIGPRGGRPGGRNLFDAEPARAALRRLLPRHAAQFALTVSPDGPADGYAIGGVRGRITVRAATGAGLLAGVGHYLRSVAGVDIGWPGDSLGALPKFLPPPERPVERTALVPHRYALNDTDAGYAGPYRSFADHEREIDLLALHGINEVFVQVGSELPLYRALRGFGYADEELLAWIPTPGRQSWWLLQNLSGFGGPVTERLMTERAAVGRRVADRLRELGMTPVLPGWFGTVPPRFAALNPGNTVVPQGDWAGFARPDWLDPTSPAFAPLAAAYYAEQRELFGDSGMYRMSPLHEGGRVGSVDVTAAARAVQRALDDAHPGALWAVLGWEDDPSPALLAGVDTERLLILDGLADRYDGLDREREWGGAPYAFGSIVNFGGHTTLGANTGVWTSRFPAWARSPGLRGIAWLPEAGGTDPAAFALFTELAWTREVDGPGWFAAWADRRYGGPDPHARAAWEALRTGPYGTPSGTWSETQEGLFTARPSLTAAKAAYWSPTAMRYRPETVRRALDELLRVAPALRGSSAYRFDLVNTARQVLADHSRVLLPRIRAAYEAKDAGALRAAIERWQEAERLLEAVVETEPAFSFGAWTAAARAWGHTEAERVRYEYDVRSLLTVWGPERGSERGRLHDYGNREWAGLLGEFHAPRWRDFLAGLEESLRTGTPPKAIAWHAREEAWARRRTEHPTGPRGDAYERARAVARAVAADPGP